MGVSIKGVLSGHVACVAVRILLPMVLIFDRLNPIYFCYVPKRIVRADPQMNPAYNFTATKTEIVSNTLINMCPQLDT